MAATTLTDIRTDSSQQSTFINALNISFGRAGSGLDFQVGSTSADSLKVSLSSSSTVNLYQGQALNVATAQDAAAAVLALDTAINTITSLRGVLLDTDVASESTAYATSQVQLQAGIAVLAQANQLPQNLLKLIS
jgi:flagellin